MKLVVSREALADLEEIWLYIGADNPEAADGVIDLLKESFNKLLDNPQIGRVREDLWPKALCYVVFKSSWRSRYLIFYRVNRRKVEIARVLEGHRDITPEFFS